MNEELCSDCQKKLEPSPEMKRLERLDTILAYSTLLVAAMSSVAFAVGMPYLGLALMGVAIIGGFFAFVALTRAKLLVLIEEENEDSEDLSQ